MLSLASAHLACAKWGVHVLRALHAALGSVRRASRLARRAARGSVVRVELSGLTVQALVDAANGVLSLHTRLALVSRDVGVLSNSAVLAVVVALALGDEALGVFAHLTRRGAGVAEFSLTAAATGCCPRVAVFAPGAKGADDGSPVVGEGAGGAPNADLCSRGTRMFALFALGAFG